MDFRITFKTKDGCLVQNRIVHEKSVSFYHYRGRWDEAFVKVSLERDCCEKGVRLVSQTRDTKTGIDCIVAWL